MYYFWAVASLLIGYRQIMTLPSSCPKQKLTGAVLSHLSLS